MGDVGLMIAFVVSSPSFVRLARRLPAARSVSRVPTTANAAPRRVGGGDLSFRVGALSQAIQGDAL